MLKCECFKNELDWIIGREVPNRNVSNDYRKQIINVTI